MNILKPLENFYQAIIKNPRTALATLGIGAGLTGALFPKTSASIIDYLDMSPTKSLETKCMETKSLETKFMLTKLSSETKLSAEANYHHRQSH